MPSPARLLSPALAALTLSLAACVKPAEQTSPANKPEPKAEPFSTAAAAAPANPPSVAGIPAAAIGAAERAKARVELATTDTAGNGAIFTQAKTLFAEKKYTEALRALDTIQTELLTPEQEKAVAALRAEITKARGQ